MAHERVRSHRSASRRARCSQRVGGGERAVVVVLAERGERRQDSSHRGGRLRRHPDQRRQRTVAADNRRDHPQPEYVHQPVGLRDRVDARRRAELPVRDQHRRERGRPDQRRVLLDSCWRDDHRPQVRPGYRESHTVVAKASAPRSTRGRSLDSDGFLTSATQARQAAPKGGEKPHLRRKEPSGPKSARPSPVASMRLPSV